MQDDAIIANGKNIWRGTAPNTPNNVGCTAGHITPDIAIVMQDGAGAADNEDIRWGTAPNT